MNITKTIAEEVTEQLLTPSKEKYDKLSDELQIFLYEIGKAQLPEEVRNTFIKYPEYFSTAYNFVVMYEFDNCGYRTIKDCLPYSNNKIKLSQKEHIIFKKKTVVLENLKKEIQTLRKEINSTLLRLRTYKRVEENFPEAFKLLPPPNVSVALTIPIKDIQTKLKLINNE